MSKIYKGSSLLLDTDTLEAKVTTIENKIGAANGIAILDSNGRVPANMLPSSAMTIVGYLDAANEHTLPEVSTYDPGSEILITSDGYYNQSTAFTLSAGYTLTTLEASEANTLINYGYVFTLTSGNTILGTVKNFATNKVVFSDDTEIELPYEADISATSEPSIVQVPVSKGDIVMVIDGHWIHLDNTSSVSSVNSKQGAVVLTASDINTSRNETIEVEITALNTTAEKVKASEEEGNTLTLKEDGFYVPSSETKISVATLQSIETKEDGIYVKKAVEQNYKDGGTYYAWENESGKKYTVKGISDLQIGDSFYKSNGLDAFGREVFEEFGIIASIDAVNVTFTDTLDNTYTRDTSSDKALAAVTTKTALNELANVALDVTTAIDFDTIIGED